MNSQSITVFDSNNRSASRNVVIEKYPNYCPFCHKVITPELILGYHIGKIKSLRLVFSCPSIECQEIFIAYYQDLPNSGIYYFEALMTGMPESKIFSDTIKEISESFISIYNEAYFAEQNKLLQICGGGYRKALEYLIKDYIIKLNPILLNQVEKLFLIDCINKHITDKKIKDVSKRAVWLGNDETHYMRKWKDKDVSDLKSLINLTIHWIEAEELTKQVLNDMPSVNS